MTIDQLNSRYGAPGRIVFHEGLAGYPEVVIANKFGTADVALLGANVLSYRPTGHSQVVFRPLKRDYNRGESMHAGIPVCWPQFGNRFTKSLPQHGFARLMVFEVRRTEYSEEMTEITLGLKSDAETIKLWPHEFDLEVKISVSMKLNLSMTTSNTGKEAFEFSCGFHPYFRIRNRNDVLVRGLDGLGYFNGIADVANVTQAGDLKMDTEADHIFTMQENPKHEYAIIDPGLNRVIAMVSSGNFKTVVWNPGPKGRLGDFEPDDWKKFVCVEPVSEWPGGRTLDAGEKYELLVAIQSTLEMRQ